MSLLAWYPLIANGNNQGLDGVNLTTVGSVTYTAGKLGNAATFPNNSGIRFRRVNFTEQTGWSVAAWVKCSAATSTIQWAFNNGRDSNNDGWHCYFSAAGTTLYLRIGSSSWSMTSTLGTWYHVCMTVDDNSKYTFYVNGEQKSTGTVATLPDYSESGNLMAIGGFVYNGGNIYPLNGQVQDFRYYNHVLSKKEVKELSKGLCLHLPLDWGGNENILPYTSVASTPSEYNAELGRTVYVRSTTATSESYIWGGRSDVVEQSTKYTFSAWVWVNEYVKSVEIFWLSTNTTNKKTGTAYDSAMNKAAWNPTPNKWQFVTWTFTTKANDYTGVIRWDNNGSSTSGTAAILKVANMKLEKGEIATPYIPHSSDTIYATEGFANKYLQDCSGYNYTITKTGTNLTSCSSPKNVTGTNIGANSSIALGKSIKLPYDFTFTFWFNTSKLDNNNQRLISCTESGGWNIEHDTSALRFSCNFNGTYKLTVMATPSANLLNTWHYLAVTYDGLKVCIYLDGVLDVENTLFTTKTAVTYNASNGVFLGAEAGASETTPGTVYATDTYMSDFRFYATALSADDIKELYNVAAQIDKSGNMYCNQLVEV